MGKAGNPVLAGGVNRSGTSFVRQRLGSLADPATPPIELEFFERLDVRPNRRLVRAEAERSAAVLAWPEVVARGLDRAPLRCTVAAVFWRP